MREFFQWLQGPVGEGADATNLQEVVIGMTLCLVCTLIVGWVYRFTHRSVSYSQSYVQTLVLVSLVTTLIMIVIGSNIARAFSLVGALSIIRFRNAVKETRDVGYIFFAMAIAMACGTRFWNVAIVATAFISSVMLLMHFLNFGATRTDPECLLRLQLPEGMDFDKGVVPTLRNLVKSYSIILVESTDQGSRTEFMLSVRPRSNVSGARVIEELSKVNGNLKATYNYALHTDDL